MRNVEAGGKDYASNGLDGGRHLEKIDPLRRAGGALFPAAVGLLHNGLDCGRMVYWQGWHFRHQQRQSGYDDFNPNYHGNYHRGNILMGQYFGSKDRSNRVKTNRTMFGFALSAGALLSVLLFLLSRPILAALRAPALEEATSYLQVCSAGLIAIFGYNALAAMLRSVGNSKQPFYCVAVTAGCNIALDCLFMGASDGACGARPWPRCLPSGPALWSAWCMCCVTGTCLAWFGGRFLSTRIRWSRFSSWGFLRGADDGGGAVLAGDDLSYQRLRGEASAASGICAKVKDVALLVTIALYTAATTMVAQCLGAKSLTGPAGWSMWPCACPWRLRRCSFWD